SVDRAVVVAGITKFLRAIAAVESVEGVTQSCLEASEVRRVVVNRVVNTTAAESCVVIAKGRTDRSRAIGQAERAGYTGAPHEAQVGRAAQGQAASLSAFQTDVGVTAEQATIVGVVTIINGDTAFQDEQGFQAVAEIFNATDAPAGLSAQTAIDAVGFHTIDFRMVKTSINQTVQRDRALCLGGACKASQHGGSKKRFFHWMFLHSFEFMTSL